MNTHSLNNFLGFKGGFYIRPYNDRPFLFERKGPKEAKTLRRFIAPSFGEATACDGSDFVSRDAPPVLCREQCGGHSALYSAGIFTENFRRGRVRGFKLSVAPNGFSPTDKRCVPKPPERRAHDVLVRAGSCRRSNCTQPHKKSDQTAGLLLLFRSFSFKKRKNTCK